MKASFSFTIDGIDELGFVVSSSYSSSLSNNKSSDTVEGVVVVDLSSIKLGLGGTNPTISTYKMKLYPIVIKCIKYNDDYNDYNDYYDGNKIKWKIINKFK